MMEQPQIEVIWKCPSCESQQVLERSEYVSGGAVTRWIPSQNSGQCDHEGRPTVKRLVKVVMRA